MPPAFGGSILLIKSMMIVDGIFVCACPLVRMCTPRGTQGAHKLDLCNKLITRNQAYCDCDGCIADACGIDMKGHILPRFSKIQKE